MRRKDNRRHHRVPVALLGRFSSDGTDKGELHVLDLGTRTWRARPSTPEYECRERGYYALDVEGIEPGAVEDLLAQKCEGPARPVLVELATSQGAVTAEGMGALVALCGMQLVRVESFRKRAAKIEAEVAQRFARLEWLKRESSNTRAVRIMLNVFRAHWPWLVSRDWTIATLAMGAPDLICSECPAKFVHFSPLTGMRVVPFGVKAPDVMIVMPLSPRQLLVGYAPPAQCFVGNVVPDRSVPEFNRAIAAESRWVYARERSAILEGEAPVRLPPWSLLNKRG